MGAAVDTSLVREIGQDQTKMVWLLLGAILFVAAGYWLVTGDFSNTRRGAIAPYAGWACIVFFGACALVAIYKLFRPASPLTLSANGIRLAHSTELVPWAGVVEVREEQKYKNKYVALVLDPVFAKSRILSTSARMLAGLAPEKIVVSASTLKASHVELLQLIVAYAEAHRHNVAAAPNASAADRPTTFGRRPARQ